MTLRQLLKRCKSMIAVMRGGRWGYFYDRLPGAKPIFNLTNLLPHPTPPYRYILLGGHGVGLTAMKYYLERCGAKPLEIFSYENTRPFVFWRRFHGLVMDKAPLNPGAKSVLATLTHRVPLYQIIRDPISIIKSNVNATMLHTISTIRTQADATALAQVIVRDISHLMVSFASMRDLVAHITSDVSYLRMEDIDDAHMPITMQKFCNRFHYTNCDYGAESVVKGSLFPRCFPYIFHIDKAMFALSTPSRLLDKSSAEINVSSHISKKRLTWEGAFDVLETYHIKGYEGYPLSLVCAPPPPQHHSIIRAKEQARIYIEEVKAYIHIAQQFAFDEERLIHALLEDKMLARALGERIMRECRYIQQELPSAWDSYAYTHSFLRHVGLM